jgi:carbon-monoxide dehydrogenase large subunit
MATDEVRHVGEIVAMVIATSAAAAKDAAEVVTVAYDPLSALTRALEAVAPDAVRMRGDGGNILRRLRGG